MPRCAGIFIAVQKNKVEAIYIYNNTGMVIDFLPGYTTESHIVIEKK
jgi:hypothetical protein